MAALAVLGLIQAATGWWWLTALTVVPVWIGAYHASRPWAVHLPPSPGTVGELVIRGTRFRDHAHSGYRWSRRDVELKVRLIVAESAGLPLDAVQTDTKFVDL